MWVGSILEEAVAVAVIGLKGKGCSPSGWWSKASAHVHIEVGRKIPRPVVKKNDYCG